MFNVFCSKLLFLVIMLTSLWLAQAVQAQAPKPPQDGVFQVFHPIKGYLTFEEFYRAGVRHGPSRRFNERGLYSEANYAMGKLEGFWRRYEQGNLTGETFYKNGKAEGPTFLVRGDYRMSGQYVDDHQEGRWLVEWKGHWRQEKNYQGGRLHGLWEHKSVDGKYVLRLQYEKGELASQGEELKDLPFLQKVTELAKSGKDPLAEYCLGFLQSPADLDYPETPLKEVLEDLKERFLAPIYVDPTIANEPKIMEQPVCVDEKVISIFLGLHEIVGAHGLTFDYRFHSFWLTTSKEAAEWKDPTGVSDLKPAEGSALAKALSAPANVGLAKQLVDLPKAVKEAYGFELDISGVVGNPWGPPDVNIKDRPGVPRPLFRDVLFIALYQNKCRCREDGGKLILERVAK